jgi:hypothetical protein
MLGMSWMSSLNRRELLPVPSYPLLSIITGTASAMPVLTLRIPAMNARVCFPAMPKRVVPLSVDTPRLSPPIVMLSCPVVIAAPA